MGILAGLTAAAGSTLGGLAGNAVLRMGGPSPSDRIHEYNWQMLANSRKDLTNANNKAIQTLQDSFKAAQSRYGNAIEMGNQAMQAFNETLGLGLSLSDKQLALQNVIAGKADVSTLKNLFPSVDVNQIQQDLFSPRKVNQTYQEPIVDLKGQLFNRAQLQSTGWGKKISSASLDQLFSEGGQWGGVKYAGVRDATRQVNDPNYTAPSQQQLQEYITNNAIANNQQNPFDPRSPLQKYQDTAGFQISQQQISDAQKQLARQFAGSGLLNSGNYGVALAQKGVDMGNASFGQYQQNLFGSATTGQNAVNSLNQLGQTNATNIAQLQRQQGVDMSNLNMLQSQDKMNWILGNYAGGGSNTGSMGGSF